MQNTLTITDLFFILESLKYTRQKFENYEYPTYELKQTRLLEVDNIIAKIQAMKDALKAP